MKVEVHLVEPATGRRGIEVQEFTPLKDAEEQRQNLLYLWMEGNYSCDCNRALFLARALKEPEPDLPCNADAASARFFIERFVVDGVEWPEPVDAPKVP